MIRHNLLDRILNRFALQSRGFRKFCFERECDRNEHQFDPDRQHVFISGLARSGSTALLNSLYASGAFASTTYDLMPFVMAPSLAQITARIPRRQIGSQERSHGDAIQIGPDSAEALDGVFWNTFLRASDRPLQARKVPLPILQKYAMFADNLARHRGRERYLSKMNQAIELVDALAAFFRHAVILLPFREPLQQCASLLRQHRNFSHLTPYEASYLGWLGHHEFGTTHTAFRPELATHSSYHPQQLDYWLEQWQLGYQNLLQLSALHANLIPVCYERMCTSNSAWDHLSERLQTRVSGAQFGNRNPAKSMLDSTANTALLEDCQALYQHLADLGLKRL